MSPHEQFSYEEKKGFFARFGFVFGILAVAVIGVVLFSQMFSGGSPPPRKEQEIVSIRPLMPPPPPPPPPPQIQPRQQVNEQTQVTEQDTKPADQPQEDPTPSLGTGITGNGPGDGFGLGGRDQGFVTGGRRGGDSGSRFGGYFSSVVRAVTDVLSRNPVTRDASFDIKVRIWSDPTGRIIRVKLADSTGNPTLDEAIKTSVLVGQQLPDMPDGMRMPLELRLNLRRPN